MDISKYSAYFHDGILVNIQHSLNNIIFDLISAEVDPNDISPTVPLSSDDTIRGKLHLINIKKIKVNNEVFDGNLQITGDNGDVFSLAIKNNSLDLCVSWICFKNKPSEEIGFSHIEVEAEKIYWEPVPDLVDPFW